MTVLFMGCTKVLSLAPEYMIVSSHAIMSLALILPCGALALCTGVTSKVPGTGIGTAFDGGGMAKAGIMGGGATSTETGAIGATAAAAIGGGGGGAIGGGAAGAEAADAEAGGADADATGAAEAGAADADATGAAEAGAAEPASIVTSVSVKRSSSTVEGTGTRSLKLAEGMVKEMRWPVGGTRADTLAPVTRGGAMPMVATKIFLPAGAASFASYTASSDRCTGRLDTTTGGAPPKVTGYLEATCAQKACALARSRSWAALSSARGDRAVVRGSMRRGRRRRQRTVVRSTGRDLVLHSVSTRHLQLFIDAIARPEEGAERGTELLRRAGNARVALEARLHQLTEAARALAVLIRARVEEVGVLANGLKDQRLLKGLHKGLDAQGQRRDLWAIEAAAHGEGQTVSSMRH